MPIHESFSNRSPDDIHKNRGLRTRIAGRIAERQGTDALGGFTPERLDPQGPRLFAQQAFEAFLSEPFLPAPDASLGFAGSPHDLVRADPVGGEQDDLSSLDIRKRFSRHLCGEA